MRSWQVLGLSGGQPALVIEGSPCQSFSIAGTRKGLEDERGLLLLKFAHTTRETLPKGFVLENVKEPANWGGSRTLSLLLE